MSISKFQKPEDLAKWLASKEGFNLERTDAENAAKILHSKKFTKLSTLRFLNMDILLRYEEFAANVPLASTVMTGLEYWNVARGGWKLYDEDEEVKAWRGFAEDPLVTLPGPPFYVHADGRPRFELIGRFFNRTCFASFEQEIADALANAEHFMRVLAVSVLGAKGAGKSTFFRYFVYKHCTKRLAVYVPNAGTATGEIYRLLMNGLIFGLQCLATAESDEFLYDVRKKPETGTPASFRSYWGNWSKTYPGICKNAYFVIDQLKRSGDLFDDLKNYPIEAAGYFLISSTGILHHHNVSDVYAKLVYSYPVSRAELTELGVPETETVPLVYTMLGAISILEGTVEELRKHYKNAARKHYEYVRSLSAEYVPRLLAVVQAEQAGEAIDGIIWEEVLDVNYFWIRSDYKVGIVSPDYMTALKALLVEVKIAYRKVLMDLLSSLEIVENVGNGALGVHVEALLDLEWQELKTLSWNEQRSLCPGVNRGSRSRGKKHINGVRGETFEDIQPICFDGMLPPVDTDDWENLDWDKPVYFKPNKTNYEGFDMFVFRKVRDRGVMHAIQVTVSDARLHGIEAFDNRFLNAWNDRIRKYTGSAPDWYLYMLTPEDNPQAVVPSMCAAFGSAPIYQISFESLVHSGNRYCGIQVVNDFPSLLKAKKEKKREKLS